MGRKMLTLLAAVFAVAGTACKRQTVVVEEGGEEPAPARRNDQSGQRTAEPDEQGTTPSYDRPSEAREVVSDEQLAKLEQAGFPIHEGSDPPDPSGVYRADSGTWIEAPREANVGTDVCDSVHELEMKGEFKVEGRSKSIESGCKINGSVGGVLSGSGDCYTLYSGGTATFEGCTYDSVSVSSGCVTERGITDSAGASLHEHYRGSSCDELVEDGRLPPEGGVLVTEETDGLVERVEK